MLYSKKGQPFALPEGESMPQDNALEFISAYNIIDARLRALYRGKGNLNFSDLVRRCADHNPVVRKYEDDLVFCAKLRNVIVHTTTTDRVVAEPCDEITQLMTHVAELLSSPPRLKLLKDKQVTGISAKETVEEALIRIAMPVLTSGDVMLRTLPYLGCFMLLAVVFSLIFTYFATAWILRPVEELAEKSRTSAHISTKYPELDSITDILNRKNDELYEQVDIIKREQARVHSAQESKNEFISNITHEMNTPLTSIKGFADLLEAGSLDEEGTKKAVSVIKAQSDRLSGLIACIINYNELSDDELPSYECDVTAVARETAESLRPAVEALGVTLEVDADEGVTVSSRQERLTEIFGNLIRNAARYNKSGGSVTVRVRGGRTPFAEVEDTGIGIAEENLDKIFSRFFTVDKSHSGKNGGFGLGLAVVRKLCDRAGWKLTVRSKLGEGTCFRIEF